MESLCVPQVKFPNRTSEVDAYRAHIDVGDANISIGERALRRYVATRRRLLVPKEAFVRAKYCPGDQAQFDFTPVPVTIAGELVVLQLFRHALELQRPAVRSCFVAPFAPEMFAGERSRIALLTERHRFMMACTRI